MTIVGLSINKRALYKTARDGYLRMPCPAIDCDKLAVYHRGEDVFIHTDHSESRGCQTKFQQGKTRPRPQMTDWLDPEYLLTVVSFEDAYQAVQRWRNSAR